MNPIRAVVGTVSAGLLLTVGIVAVRNVLHTRDAADCAPSATVVRGIVGSEKEAFLRSERVAEIFRCAGIDLRIDPRGSREMVDAVRSGKPAYDFAFPSSTPTARKIMDLRKIGESLRPFSSVMGVATFADTVAVLRANGAVQKVGGTD